MTDATDNAEKQAKAQLESIVSMIARLEHAQKCDGGADCELTDAEILDGLGLWNKNGKASAEERGEYHDEEKTRERIEEAPLSVEVRSGWHTPGDTADDEEYMILLCTGGPAVRIIGDLDQYKQPSSACLQYQDWFTPWTEYTDSDETVLIAYANLQYLGS